jgi:hypothetical protein
MCGVWVVHVYVLPLNPAGQLSGADARGTATQIQSLLATLQQIFGMQTANDDNVSADGQGTQPSMQQSAVVPSELARVLPETPGCHKQQATIK